MRFIPAVSPVQIQVPLPLPPGTYRVVRPGSQKFNGPLVKWLRHGPFTAVTWVRIPYGSPSHRTPVCAASYGRTREYRNGGLAQLVRAPASHAGGHWFESSSLHQNKGHDLRRVLCFGGETPAESGLFLSFRAKILILTVGEKPAKVFPLHPLFLAKIWANHL